MTVVEVRDGSGGIGGGVGRSSASPSAISSRGRKRKAPPPPTAQPPFPAAALGEAHTQEGSGGLLRRLVSVWGGIGRRAKAPRLFEEGAAGASRDVGRGTAETSSPPTVGRAAAPAAAGSPRPKKRRAKRSRWPLGPHRDATNNRTSVAASAHQTKSKSTANPSPRPRQRPASTAGREGAPLVALSNRSVAAVRRAHAKSDAALARLRQQRLEEERRRREDEERRRQLAEAAAEERLVAQLERRYRRRQARWRANRLIYEGVCAAAIQCRWRGHRVRRRLAGEGGEGGHDGLEARDLLTDAPDREGDGAASIANADGERGGSESAGEGERALVIEGESAGELDLPDGDIHPEQGEGGEGEQQAVVGGGEGAVEQFVVDESVEAASVGVGVHAADNVELRPEGESGEAAATMGDESAEEQCVDESAELFSHALEGSNGEGAESDEVDRHAPESNATDSYEERHCIERARGEGKDESLAAAKHRARGDKTLAENVQVLEDASGEDERRGILDVRETEQCAIASAGETAEEDLVGARNATMRQASIDFAALGIEEGAVPNIAERVKGRTRGTASPVPVQPVERNGREPARPSKLTPPRLLPPKSTAVDRVQRQTMASHHSTKSAVAWSPPNNNCADCSRLRWDLLACELCSNGFCFSCLRLEGGSITELLCKTCAGGHDTTDIEPMDEMEPVSHLCSTSIDAATGLPTQIQTVMCGDTEALYNFRVGIKPSSIPNAGHGAFLTYLGKRVLKPEAAARSARLWQQHEVDTDAIELMRHPLEVDKPDGGRMFVQLSSSGETLPPLFVAKIGKVSREVERLRVEAGGKGIGLLGIHKESDYMPSDNDELFWNYPESLFELGRYGPHRPEDRKPLLHFDFKNFVYNNEPSEWSYEVPEELNGERQMVDITNEWGVVHAAAAQHPSIYVNEVGCNPNLRANTFIRCKNNRSVHYYVGIERENAIRKGETVELFADYGEHYEPVRERKGYGLSSHSDNHDGSRLLRNFREREAIESDISSLEAAEMHRLVEFLTKHVLEPVLERATGRRRLIARRRLHWIGKRLEVRLREYSADPDGMARTSNLLRTWRIDDLQQIYCEPMLIDELHQVYCNELTEELLYGVRHELFKADGGNETFWSGLAENLWNELDSFERSGVHRERLQANVLKAAKSYAALVQGWDLHAS
ncbi:hypothetical protein ACHAXT_003756 [Thalassiosira profunda]